MSISRLLLLLLLVTGCTQGPQSGSPPLEPVVMGPGTITIDDNNIFQGRFSPDGQAFWFFRKVTEGREDYRIHVSHLHDGAWQPARIVEPGDGSHSDLYPAVSPDGRFLVFSSYRPAYEGHGNSHIWMAPLDSNGVGQPVPVDVLNLPGHYHSGLHFDGRGRLVFHRTLPDWSQTEEVRATYADGAFQEPEIVTQTLPFSDWRSGQVRVWAQTFHPDGHLAVVEISELDSLGNPGPSSLWFARQVDGVWSEPANPGTPVNSDVTSNFVVFSPDGQRLHYVQDFARYLTLDVPAIEAFLQAR